jgi:hypothetical protein
MNQKDVVNVEQKENKLEDQETAISRNFKKNNEDPFLGIFFSCWIGKSRNCQNQTNLLIDKLEPKVGLLLNEKER